MTPLTKIENGILKNNWALVCEGFNKLTGKKLNPPAVVVTVKTEAKFNPDTANKRALYNWMKEKIDIAPMKSYTIDELREMVWVHSMSEPDEPKGIPVVQKANAELKDGAVFLDGFRFHSGRKKLLPMDKIKVTAVLDPQLAKVGDPTNEYTPREPPKRVQMKCLKCSKRFENFAGLGVEVDGEVKALCPVCAESI